MWRTLLITSLAMAASLCLMGAAEPPSEPPSEAAPAGEAPTDGGSPAAAPQAPWTDGVASLLRANKPAKATRLCEDHAVRPTVEATVAHRLCGRAYVALGDRLHRIGASERAREYWKYASKLDLELLDDDDFLRRLSGARAPQVAPAPSAPGPAPAQAATTAPSVATDTQRGVAKSAAEPKEPPGPRANRNFYMGVGAGYDGVGNLFLGWSHDERVRVEIAAGLIYPVVDSRVRILGPRRTVTTFVGLGMTTPLGNEDVFGLGLTGYESLYALGETLHVDAGLSWAASPKADVSAAVAFVSSLDPNHNSQILLFPQFALQASYGF